MNDSQLYERINRRVDLMFEAGLLDGPSGSLSTIQMRRQPKALVTRNSFLISVGSKLLRASDSLKQATRRFAKRQLTWFRNRMQVTFYQIGEPGVQTAF